MTTIGIVNGSAPLSGITLSTEPYAEALRGIGFDVRWYQCVDFGQPRVAPFGGSIVPGLGVPVESVDLGLNRLWIFPRRLRGIPERYVLLSDPTLIRVARFHPRTIVLVHDLLPLSPFADRLDARWMFRYILPRLTTVSRVIVDTAAVGDELLRRGVRGDKIRVVPLTHALGHHPEHVQTSVDRVRNLSRIRVLYVTTDRPFKNIEFFLQIAHAMAQRRSDPRFEFTLLSRLTPATERRVRDLALTNLRVVPRVANIAQVYYESDILVHPSLSEGFGRPLIEAMAYGLPILAHRIPPLAEVLGDAGLLLRVDRPDDWATGLESLADPEVLRRWALRSLERGLAYSPEQFRVRVSQAFADLPA